MALATGASARSGTAIAGEYEVVNRSETSRAPTRLATDDLIQEHVRLQPDLLVIGDSIRTDRHPASDGNNGTDDPQNQVGGGLPSFPLSRWLRHERDHLSDVGWR